MERKVNSKNPKVDPLLPTIWWVLFRRVHKLVVALVLKLEPSGNIRIVKTLGIFQHNVHNDQWFFQIKELLLTIPPLKQRKTNCWAGSWKESPNDKNYYHSSNEHPHMTYPCCSLLLKNCLSTIVVFSYFDVVDYQQYSKHVQLSV